MNRFLLFPLFVFLGIGILTILIGEVYTITYYDPIEEVTYVFNYNLQDYVNSAIVGLVGGLIFIGLKIVGSGLNDETVRIISSCIIYGTIWGSLSVFASAYIRDIEIFGVIIWSILSVLYIFGVAIEITESSASE